MMNTVTDGAAQMLDADDNSKRVGDTLLKLGKVNVQDLSRIIAKQESANMLFGEAAIALGLINQTDLTKALSAQFEYAYADQQHKLNLRLVAAHSPFADEVEKLRSLREYLLMHWFSLGNQCLTIVSTAADDNASELAANLAIVFSQLNRKTLLIDANLRSPKQERLFGLDAKLGLANILANKEGQYHMAKVDGLPSLSVLTAGTAPPNPQELLNREAFASLIADLKKLYEVILIDTCPAAFGSDYLAVTKQTQSALIVTRQHHTSVNALAQLKAQLDFSKANIVGCTIQQG